MNNNTKVLLVKCLDPEKRDVYAFRQIPLGIAYLASVLKNYCDLEVFDMLVDDDLLDKIRRSQPDIIGLSILSVDFIYIEKLIKTIRTISPRVFIIAGGAHATVEPVETLDAGIDLVVRSEGEKAISAIVKGVNSGELKLEKIPGISYLNPNQTSSICHNPIIYEENIDILPMPSIEVFDWTKYDQFPILTSRGCPYGCKFCASKTIWGQKVRFHSADRVFAEIVRAVEDYNFNHFVFVDDTLTLNHKRLFELCDLILKSGYDITWSVNSRVDTINRDVAQRISKAGCRVVSFGIETGSELIQKAIEKRLSQKQIKKAIKACKQAGIRVKTGWMIGLPGNYEEQMKSLNLMLELNPDEITIHHFIPIPGTVYWHNPEKYGLSFERFTLMNNFSFDVLPNQVSLKFDYITNEEIETLTHEMIQRLQEAGYKRPGELTSYDLTSKVVNTYEDRRRLPVLPSKK